MIIFHPDYLSDKNVNSPRIKVIGIGGAGGNALQTLISYNLQGIDFIAINTDAQALARVDAPYKLQLAHKHLRGMGTGANPEIGRQAAEEDAQKISDIIKDGDIVFLLAGLGGGTGSGAISVIAKILQEKNILSVALVTKPFIFEGSRRMNIAESVLEKLEEYVDSVIVIPNQKLFESQENISLMQAFEKINNVMGNCIKTVADTIHRPGHINIDFADIRATMTRMGKAVMGIGRASGQNRAQEAIEAAVTSKLLEHTSLKGARSILLNIVGNESLTLHEVGTIAAYIHDQADHDARITLGSGTDQALGDEIIVTLIATGFENHVKARNIQKNSSYQMFSQHNEPVKNSSEPYNAFTAHRPQNNAMEMPAFLKKLMAENSHQEK